jgi:hypothetical protein
MIDRCFNPVCKRMLHYLQDGRVVRVIRGNGEDVSVEHYWLCGPCYAAYDFEFPPDGGITIRSRAGGDQPHEFYLNDVLLPDRRNARRMPSPSR